MRKSTFLLTASLAFMVAALVVARSGGGIDSALMVDAYHEFSHPREMMEGLRRALKPGGRIYLVEYRGEDAEIPILPLHKMTVRQARKELEAVGFEFVENRGGLPTQHLMVFEKPGTR